MTAVEEFAVGEATTPDASPAPPRRRGRRDRGLGWVALAAAAIVGGTLLGPTTPVRTSAEVPVWGGLQAILVMDRPEDADLVAMARDAVDRARPTWTVDTRVPDEARQEAPTSRQRVGVIVLVAGDAEPDDLVSSVTMPSDQLIDTLDAAAPREDWVCVTTETLSRCTSLSRGVAVTVIREPEA